MYSNSQDPLTSVEPDFINFKNATPPVGLRGQASSHMIATHIFTTGYYSDIAIVYMTFSNNIGSPDQEPRCPSRKKGQSLQPVAPPKSIRRGPSIVQQPETHPHPSVGLFNMCQSTISTLNTGITDWHQPAPTPHSFSPCHSTSLHRPSNYTDTGGRAMHIPTDCRKDQANRYTLQNSARHQLHKQFLACHTAGYLLLYEHYFTQSCMTQDTHLPYPCLKLCSNLSSYEQTNKNLRCGNRKGLLGRNGL